MYRKEPKGKMTEMVLNIIRSKPDEVERLIREGGGRLAPVLGFRHVNGASLLHMVASTGNIEIARILLSFGHPIDVRNKEEETPLMVAVSFQHLEMIRFLIENHADVNAKRSNGATSLHLACTLGNTRLAQLLIESGADVDIPNNNSDTALIVAVDKGFDELCELLIRSESDPCKKRRNGATALHIAAAYEDPTGKRMRILNMLLERTPIDIENNDKETPLMVALARKSVKNVKRLIEAGAKVDICSVYGVTVFDLAVVNYECWKVLLRGTDGIGYLLKQPISFERVISVVFDQVKKGSGKYLYYMLAFTVKGRGALKRYLVWLLEKYRDSLGGISERIGERVLAYIDNPEKTSMELREFLGPGK